MKIQYILTEDEYIKIKVMARSSYSKYKTIAEVMLENNQELAKELLNAANKFKEIYDMM